jgi:hypothetical protein
METKNDSNLELRSEQHLEESSGSRWARSFVGRSERRWESFLVAWMACDLELRLGYRLKFD